MPAKCYVFNEWVLHDLGGENGPEARSEAVRLLERLRNSGDRIAIATGSPWVQKAYSLNRSRDPEVLGLSRFLHGGILTNRRVCLWLDPAELEPLPEDEKTRLPPEDVYLVELYRAANADLIVTTGEELLETADQLGIRIARRDDFLAEYL